MKKLFAFLLKAGLLAGIVYAAAMSNPDPARHRSAIESKEATLKEKDILGQANRMIHSSSADKEEHAAMTYHNYFMASKVTDPDGDMLSFGFFGKVFVTQKEY